MVHVDQQRLYHDLAWLWPIISPAQDYIVEALQIAGLIRQHSCIPVHSLLHLGCGGGHLDATLKKYFQVSGVDLSEHMLSLARELNPEVNYQQGDMRTYGNEELFDAVLIADSIDYMLTEDDLKQVFRTAYTQLSPGGVFITYAEETEESFVNNKTSCSEHSQEDLHVAMLENLFDPDPDDHIYEMSFIYLIRRGGELTVELDRHQAGLFSLETWLRLMANQGFDVVVEEMEGEEVPMLVGIKPLSSQP